MATVTGCRTAESLAAAGPDAPPWLSVYIKSLYWALSTTSSLGYGEGPRAHTDAEFVMSIGCQVVGACLYAAIFGNIAQLIQKIDALGTRCEIVPRSSARARARAVNGAVRAVRCTGLWMGSSRATPPLPHPPGTRASVGHAFASACTLGGHSR